MEEARIGLKRKRGALMIDEVIMSEKQKSMGGLGSMFGGYSGFTLGK
jgi:hypothetical protein